jgi:hypothetical protein
MLNRELRIKSGLTYGATSRFEQRKAVFGRNQNRSAGVSPAVARASCPRYKKLAKKTRNCGLAMQGSRNLDDGIATARIMALAAQR